MCCRAAQMSPKCNVSGLVMLAPMIALEKVMQKSVVGPIKNKHLAPIAGLLSFLVPTLPLIAKSESVLAQQIDQEFRNDITNYTGSVRVRVAHHFNKICKAFTAPDGPKALDHVACPAMLTIHANADTMTEPGGSVQLFERASCERKTLVLISGPDGQPGAAKTYANGKARDGLAKGRRRWRRFRASTCGTRSRRSPGVKRSLRPSPSGFVRKRTSWPEMRPRCRRRAAARPSRRSGSGTPPETPPRASEARIVIC